MASPQPLPDKVVMGKVITGPGIEIRTVHPRFSIVTKVSALPENPRVRLHFDGQGDVVDAELLRSSGHEGVDGPVLASLYEWQAEGPRLEARDGFTLTIELTFN